MENIILNMEQRLFVIQQDYGYSCLGFDVCYDRASALAKELKHTFPGRPEDNSEGLMNFYVYYQELVEIARQKHLKTGWKSKSQLTKQLIGLEGRVVRVVDTYGDERVFIVGRSSGFIPCHLEIETSEDDGGSCAYGTPFKKVQVIK